MYNTFNIEGVSDNQRSQLLQIYIPPIEAIQEVQITTSNYDPQQGTALGAVTNVSLRSNTSRPLRTITPYITTSGATSAGPFRRAKRSSLPVSSNTASTWGSSIQ
jgi:hypothetical protein